LPQQRAARHPASLAPDHGIEAYGGKKDSPEQNRLNEGRYPEDVEASGERAHDERTKQ
jgi:hypothetical protein